jgi:hypothetical protein
MRKLLLNYLSPIEGYYLPEVYFNPKRKVKIIAETKIRNKGYRNMAYWLNAFITNSSQTLIDTGGGSRTYNPRRQLSTTASISAYPIQHIYPYRLNIGSSSSPHDVSRYELYTRHFTYGAGGIGWIYPETTQTRFRTYHRYMFPSPDKAVGEVGLYLKFLVIKWDLSSIDDVSVLLARAILDPVITKPANTLLEEGWEITFPANYTRWLLEAVWGAEGTGESALGKPIMDTSGASYIMREGNPLAGTPDVRIGRNNTAPSPTHYNLLDPIGSLGSQSQGVEIDTTLQECRIVRIGTYTPSVNETLGEVGLFCNVYDTGGTARTIMIARGIWDPPVTLVAGTTYTIGIVLRMG